MYNLRDDKCILHLEVLGQCSNLSVSRYQLFFFPRFKNRDIGDNRGAEFQISLQLRNFAVTRKTVIPVYHKALFWAVNPRTVIDICYNCTSTRKALDV